VQDADKSNQVKRDVRHRGLIAKVGFLGKGASGPITMSKECGVVLCDCAEPWLVHNFPVL